VVLVLLAVAIIGAGTVTSLYVLSLGRGSSTASTLPPGCTKPAGGFLLVASHLGWNDSVLMGAGVTPGVVWPKMTVTQGQTVTVTVCNTDVQAHSFQVAHYEQGAANTLVPGQVKTFQFVATDAGTFQVYCEIECSIHIYMQAGQLVVTPS
jgi:hypothetical protein